MFASTDELNAVIHTTRELLKAAKKEELLEVLDASEIHYEQTHWDNWNGGTAFYTLYLNTNVDIFIRYRENIQSIEAALVEFLQTTTRHRENDVISNVVIVPISQPKIDWSRLTGVTTKEQLTADINFLRNTLISVSTGGPRIQDVNDEYNVTYQRVQQALSKIALKNPNPFKDLWEWYGKWRADFVTYAERRWYVKELYDGLYQILSDETKSELVTVSIDLSNWERIERSVNEIKVRSSDAKNEEQFQVIGLLCRETIITLAQTVFVNENHPILDGKEVSKTDAKRMLEAYIAVELSGPSNETLRKFARATLDLANELTHRRSATRKEAFICSTATISLINLIGTVEGRF